MDRPRRCKRTDAAGLSAAVVCKLARRYRAGRFAAHWLPAATDFGPRSNARSSTPIKRAGSMSPTCFGFGFAQGKTMLWRRADLERAGGIEALAKEVAEDAASTKIVRAAGRKVRLVAQPFPQPLGHRSASEVWNRQLRWARLRRAVSSAASCRRRCRAGCCRLSLLAVVAPAIGLPRALSAVSLGCALVWRRDASRLDSELAPVAALSSRLLAARSFVAGVVRQSAERQRLCLARQRNAGRAAAARER